MARSRARASDRRDESRRFEPVDVPSEQPTPARPSASRLLRDRRLVQATWAASAAIVVSGIPDVVQRQWRNLPPLFVGLAAMGCVLWLVRAGRRGGAVALLLSSLMGMVGLLMWRNGGLRDTSLLAFPCLLVLAAMMGSRWSPRCCWPTSTAGTSTRWRRCRPTPSSTSPRC